MKCRGFFDVAGKKEEIKNLENKMSKSDFWDDQNEAQKVIARSNILKGWTGPYDQVKEGVENILNLFEEAKELDDDSFFDELSSELMILKKILSDLEVRKMLSGELDEKNCYFSINAGAGGTESCDWVLMLSRMYQRWFQRKGFKCQEIDVLDGEVAGIKNITFKVDGPFAFGYCKAEKGVHRLVRISPFDSNARRHTSFASVDVTPEIDDDIEIELKPDDIRIDTYRSSGAGGQHVNTTDSAVRITHLPTKIVVTCQNERSQIQNRETCLKMLKAKLYERRLEERKESIGKLGGEKKEIGFGSQIRSYVFQPYTLVKDARTKVEDGNIIAVMDGEIDHFIDAFLKQFG